mmetsp:Transcript_89364/g.273663  ORF Transcript_89364/g.273663 Transcript_89364/m.273663 type:complete len:652 (+) Transcript_89364:181-2136(+)
MPDSLAHQHVWSPRPPRHTTSPGLDVVPAFDLHVHDVVLRVLLGMAAAIADRLDHCPADLRRHVAAGAAEVQVAVLLVDEVVDKLHLLLQPMGHVDFLLLLAAQREGDGGQHAFLVVVVELLLVAVLDAVARAEEERHGCALLAGPVGGHALLDEGAHWRDARAEADHQQGRLVGLGHDHRRFVDLGRHAQAAARQVQLLQPPGALTDALPPAGGDPIIPDDAEVALVLAPHARRGGDGVQAGLDVRHVVDEVPDGRHRAGELLQQLGVGVALRGARLVVLLAVPGAQVRELLLILRVRGAHLQHLVEAALGPAADVQDLGEQTPHGDVLRQRHRARGVDVPDVQHLVARALQGLQTSLDVRLAVRRVHAQGVALLVDEAAAREVEHEVVDRTLVTLRDLGLRHLQGYGRGVLWLQRLRGLCHKLVRRFNHLDEVCRCSKLCGGLRRLDVVEEVGLPILQDGVVTGGVLVIAQADVHQALGTQLTEHPVDLDGRLVEEGIGRVTHAEDGKPGVLEVICGRGLHETLRALPELDGSLRHVALPSGGHHGQDLGLFLQVAELNLIEGHALGAHATALELEVEVLGDHLRVARVAAVEDGHALPGGLLAHPLLQILQQVLVAHGHAAPALMARGRFGRHGALEHLGMLRRHAEE